MGTKEEETVIKMAKLKRRLSMVPIYYILVTLATAADCRLPFYLAKGLLHREEKKIFFLLQPRPGGPVTHAVVVHVQEEIILHPRRERSGETLST